MVTVLGLSKSVYLEMNWSWVSGNEIKVSQPQELVKWESFPLPLAEGKSGSPLTYTCGGYQHIKAHAGLLAPPALFTSTHSTFQSWLATVGHHSEWHAHRCFLSIFFFISNTDENRFN